MERQGFCLLLVRVAQEKEQPCSRNIQICKVYNLVRPRLYHGKREWAWIQSPETSASLVCLRHTSFQEQNCKILTLFGWTSSQKLLLTQKSSLILCNPCVFARCYSCHPAQPRLDISHKLTWVCNYRHALIPTKFLNFWTVLGEYCPYKLRSKCRMYCTD